MPSIPRKQPLSEFLAAKGFWVIYPRYRGAWESDVLGLTLKFESPGWSEFVTGETTLALHPASDKNPAGKVEMGFTVADVEAFYRDMSAKGVLFALADKHPTTGENYNGVHDLRGNQGTGYNPR